MLKKQTSTRVRIITLGLTLFLGLAAAVPPAWAKSLSQLAAELKGKPKGAAPALRLAEELAKLTPGCREEIDLLLELIQEQEGPAREKLINSISRINDPKLGPVFLKELKHPHPMVQAVAAGMCGKLKLVEAEGGLIRLIRQSPPIVGFPDTDQERAVVTAVLALGELRQDSSLDFLLSLLGTMKGYEVQALRKFGVKPLAALLAKLNHPEASSNAKAAAVQVIMALEDEAALPLLEQEVAKLDSKARPYVITTVLKLDPEKSLPSLIAKWESKPDFVLETRLLYYINSWRLGDARLAPFLIKVLQSSVHPSSRRLAVASLARIKSEASLAALRQAAEDEDKGVRLYAKQALEMMSPAKPKE
jgi:HEAT repeat protein